MMGIVHHANYLVYCEAARVDWLHKRGVSYAEWERMGIHLPVVDVRLRYRQAARFDEELEVVTTLCEISRVAIRFQYRILREGALLCEIETQLACVGAGMALRRLPEDALRAFRGAEETAGGGAPLRSG